MDRLPDTSAFPRNQIIYPKPGPFDYEHPIRASGARLIEIDYHARDALDRIEKSIRSTTAAIGYAWYEVEEKPKVRELAQLAHRHDLPLIVDAAMSLPPAENLRKFIQDGADLVVFSGGKHIAGPQASGILCGRGDLIRGTWVQMVDMDVRAGTWSLQRWVEQGWIARPPRHGIGRSMKVGKEAIIGLMTALEAYLTRDCTAEQKRWRAMAEEVAAGLASIAGLRVRLLFPAPNGQPFPTVQIDLPRSLQNELRSCRPKIILAEDESNPKRVYLYPMCLRDDDPQRIVSAFENVLKKV